MTQECLFSKIKVEKNITDEGMKPMDADGSFEMEDINPHFFDKDVDHSEDSSEEQKLGD